MIAWKRDFTEPAEEFLVHRKARILEPILPFEGPLDSGNIYEFRMYRARPGMARAWCRLFVDAMPVRKALRRSRMRLDRRRQACGRDFASLGVFEPFRATGGEGASGRRSGLAGLRSGGRGHASENALDGHAAGGALSLRLTRTATFSRRSPASPMPCLLGYVTHDSKPDCGHIQQL